MDGLTDQLNKCRQRAAILKARLCRDALMKLLTYKIEHGTKLR